jgi:TolB-like protein/class 3 adenylate cyclase/Tfp pilus assembly protein PilF
VIQELKPPPRLARRLRAVLFVDVVDSVRLINQDPEGTVRRWSDFMAAVNRDELPRRRGRMVKPLGDGMLVEFESAVDAVECALAMQSRIEEGNADLAPDRRIHVRIGINLADVMADDIDLYGDGVNIAARLMALGSAQEIFISAAVRDQLTDGLDVTIEDIGERKLKGIERPVRAFRAWPPGPPPIRTADRQRHAGDRPSIAVLPFRNLSGDPTHDFLGDLIADDVIGDLSRLIELTVISRLSTSPFRDRPYEPRNVAEALGVRYVLSGNLHTSGARLRLMAELTEAGAGHVIWAERFEGSLADIFDLQDHLSQAISKRVVPYVRQLELQRARSAHPEKLTAYERTLRAIDHFHCSSSHDLDQARALLESAIQADPSYVTPYAWLAHWHVRRVGQGWSSDSAHDTIEANRYADAALQRDPNDPLALTVSGLVAGYLKKDQETAINQHNRALTINPSASSAWLWSTSAYAWSGNGEEAVRRSQRAIELSPFDPQMYMFTSIAGTAHAVAGQYDKAIEMCRRSLRQNRMFASTHRILTLSLALSGREAEAREAAVELLGLEPGLTVSGFLRRYPGSESTHARTFGQALLSAGVPP